MAEPAPALFDRIVGWSLDHRPLVLGLTLVVALVGLRSLAQLPIDAFPDTTPVQVQVNTSSSALDPVEVEQQLTLPVEQALAGLPGLVDLRSVSRFGISQVVAVFGDDVDLWFARQLVSEALTGVELAEGLPRPRMGPAATGLGEVLHYVVTGAGHDLMELTTLHDWVLRPQLLAVPDVIEVNTWGGARQQLHVVADLAALAARGLCLDDLVTALRENNRSVGGGVLSRGGEMQVVQGLALASTADEVGAIALRAEDGVPVLVRDVASVRWDTQARRGAVTANGQGEVVLGLGFLVMGANPHDVTGRLVEALEQASASLPEGVRVELLHDRTELVDQVIETVAENLLIGAGLVIAVLLLLLGNLRAGLIVAASIPLAMLASFSAMLEAGIAVSLLSLGALDFGLVVDSTVIVVENCVRRLAGAAPGADRRELIREATLEVRKPTLYGELIILVVYLPVLLLEGVEGRLFRPMALTVVFALLASLVLSLSFVPVMCSLGLRGAAHHGEGRLMALAHGLYRPVVRLAMRWRVAVLVGGCAVLVLGGVLASQLGVAFVPRLWEQSVVINTVRLAGVDLAESVRYGTRLEALLIDEFPDEIRDVWTRTGTAQVATDPMGLEVSDVFVTLTERSAWRRATSQQELMAAMQELLADMPGMRAVLTQPIEMRLNEMTAGVRADLGVVVFGDDLEVLQTVAAEVAAVLESVPGAADVAVEQLSGQPLLRGRVRRDELARHGLPASAALDVLAALGGLHVGDLRDGQRRFDLIVSLPGAGRLDPDAVGRLLVASADGALIPLRTLLTLEDTEGPASISRQWNQRRTVVQANAADQDLGGFVAEARRRLEAEVVLPPGVRLAYGGQYEHLQRAQNRLAIVVPLALLAALALLVLGTRSLRDTLVIATGAPFAAFGGVLALWLRDLPFTVSAGVGFVAVSGVSMLNGLVLVSTLRRKLDVEGLPLEQAIEETRLLRLRPILMTALVASLGFVPMALNTGLGAELQRPLATVVIGGVLADNLLTLLVLPALFRMVGRRSARGPGEAAGEMRDQAALPS